MYGVADIFLVYSMLRTISGQSVPKYEYANFGREPSNYVVHHLRSQEGDSELPHLDLQSGDNVQKLAPAQSKYFDVDDDDENLGPKGAPAYREKLHMKHVKEIVTQNVNRVQEITGQLWPMGIVPYIIDKNTYDSTTAKRITKAMNAIEAVSCLMFRELQKIPQDNLDAWLHFVNPKKERDCVHSFSVVEGGTEVVLGFDCLHPDEILHALLHALGFRDEVTHPHRDQYIRVQWNNIQPKYRELFRIREEDAAYKLVEYDPMSIMHFHDRAFSDNGAATIVALVPGLQLSASTTLSPLDIMRLKLAFGHECNKRNVGDLLVTCKNSLTPQKNRHLDPMDASNKANKNKIHEEKSESGDGAQHPDDANAIVGEIEIDDRLLEGGTQNANIADGDAIVGKIIIDDDLIGGGTQDAHNVHSQGNNAGDGDAIVGKIDDDLVGAEAPNGQINNVDDGDAIVGEIELDDDQIVGGAQNAQIVNAQENNGDAIEGEIEFDDDQIGGGAQIGQGNNADNGDAIVGKIDDETGTGAQNAQENNANNGDPIVDGQDAPIIVLDDKNTDNAPAIKGPTEIDGNLQGGERISGDGVKIPQRFESIYHDRNRG